MRMLLGRGFCLILIGVWILRESRSNVEVLGLRLARGTRMVRPRGCYRIDALGVPKLVNCCLLVILNSNLWWKKEQMITEYIHLHDVNKPRFKFMFKLRDRMSGTTRKVENIYT